MELKGRSFETEVFEFIKEELEKGNLPVKNENCKIYQNKKYKGKYREIEIDISIEVFNKQFPNQPSFYYLVECKDYKRPVDATEIEKFRQQFEDITNGSGKAIFATTSGFSKNASSQAIKIGMGIIYKIGKTIIWKAPARIIGFSIPVLFPISLGIEYLYKKKLKRKKIDETKQLRKKAIIDSNQEITLISN